MRLTTGLAFVISLGIGLPFNLLADNTMTSNSGGTANANSAYATDNSNGSTNASSGGDSARSSKTKKHHHKRSKSPNTTTSDNSNTGAPGSAGPNGTASSGAAPTTAQ